MAVRADSAPPKQDLPTGALRVLVAEDNLVNQKVLQKVLQRVTPDSPIFIANNGQEALKVSHNTIPQCPRRPQGVPDLTVSVQRLVFQVWVSPARCTGREQHTQV